jgi:very-short-patch-repair endonuclease
LGCCGVLVRARRHANVAPAARGAHTRPANDIRMFGCGGWTPSYRDMRMSLVGLAGLPRTTAATLACLAAARAAGRGRQERRKSPAGESGGCGLSQRGSRPFGEAHRVDLISHVTIMGGACTRAAVVERCGRAAVDRAIEDGVLVRVARGRYALSTATAAVTAAAMLGGVLSMRSAAQRLGWGQKKVPRLPDVTFPRNRHLDSSARAFVVPHWSDIAPEDIENGATGMRRTLIDCMRMLPLDESVPIVNSALRAGDVTLAELAAIARSMKGRGRARAMAVAAMATAKPANPYESTLYAMAATVPGLRVRPQHPIRISPDVELHPDLADPDLGLVIEAESFAWHGESAALTRDCVRYNAFTILGWTVIRFSWYQVMFEPAYVLRVLEEAVALVRRHANVARGSPAAVA